MTTWWYTYGMYGTPITHMTKAMLRNICRNEQLVYSAETTNAGLVALIEA
jgi:hypothetical protein